MDRRYDRDRDRDERDYNRGGPGRDERHDEPRGFFERATEGVRQFFDDDDRDRDRRGSGRQPGPNTYEQRVLQDFNDRDRIGYQDAFERRADYGGEHGRGRQDADRRDYDRSLGQDEGFHGYRAQHDYGRESTGRGDTGRDTHARSSSGRNEYGFGQSSDRRVTGGPNDFGRSSGYGDQSGYGGRGSYTGMTGGATSYGGSHGGSDYGPGLGQPEFGRTGGQSHRGRGPEGYARSKERIEEGVNEALMDHHDVDATGIRVQVEGGEVTLEGTVSTRREKRLAEDVAEHVRGVRDVHNRLRVQEGGGGSGQSTSTDRQSGMTGQGGAGASGSVAGQSSPSSQTHAGTASASNSKMGQPSNQPDASDT